jgi:hypothetical protein
LLGRRCVGLVICGAIASPVAVLPFAGVNEAIAFPAAASPGGNEDDSSQPPLPPLPPKSGKPKGRSGRKRKIITADSDGDETLEAPLRIDANDECTPREGLPVPTPETVSITLLDDADVVKPPSLRLARPPASVAAAVQAGRKDGWRKVGGSGSTWSHGLCAGGGAAEVHVSGTAREGARDDDPLACVSSV